MSAQPADGRRLDAGASDVRPAALANVLRHPVLWFSLSGGIAAYLCAVYWLGAPPLPLLSPDSASYWQASHMYPPGYPAIIRALYAATGTLKSIVDFQIAAFCASVLTLQAAVYVLTRSAPLAGVLALLLFSYHGLVFYSLRMLSEELFIATLLLHVAAAAFAMARESKAGLILMALTAVVAVSLRPSGYFLVGGVILLALLWRGRRRLVVQWGVGPLVLFMVVYVIFGLAVRGVATQAHTGLVLFPHVAYLYDGGGNVPAQTEHELLKAIEPFRLEREKLASWPERADYERVNFLRVFRAIRTVVRTTLPGHNPNDVLKALALHTIAKHPIEYAKLVVGATVRGFDLFALNMPRLTPAHLQRHYLQAETSRARPDLEAAMGRKFSFDSTSDYRNYFLLTHYPVPQIGSLGTWRYPLFAWIGIVSVISWSMVLFAGRTIPGVLFVSYLGALLVGAYVLIGLSIGVIERYAVPLDALLIVIGVVGISIVFNSDGLRGAGLLQHAAMRLRATRRQI